jgi:hypothetical protein
MNDPLVFELHTPRERCATYRFGWALAALITL